MKVGKHKIFLKENNTLLHCSAYLIFTPKKFIQIVAFTVKNFFRFRKFI